MLNFLRGNFKGVFFIAALLTLFFFRSQLTQSSGNGKASTWSEPIQKNAVTESVYGIGTVRANRSFQLRPGTTNTVTELFVREGDPVKKDDKLMELDSRLVFTAPFDGTITSLPVKVGENVFSQTVILEIVDMADRYLTVSLEQRAAIRVKRGQKARLSFENLRETSFEGAVESVYSNDDEFLVRIECKDLPGQILPGMTADVAIGIKEVPEAILIPLAAVQDGKVKVKRGSSAPFVTRVQTGIIDGAVAEVVSGDVKADDRVQIPDPKKT